MDKQLQTRITLQPYSKINGLNLTNLPLGNLRNPGIGLKIFDVMLPLNGVEKFEVKKEENNLTGSYEENKNDVTVNQQGYGNSSNESNNVKLNNDNSQMAKLGPVFAAMQNVKIKTKDFVFHPKKTIKKKQSKVHKFHLL